MIDVMTNAGYVVWMLIAGWCMGSVFDFYSTVTGATRYLRWLRPILDLFFWIASGLAVYYLTFITIQGEFRMYTFLLICVGYLVYRAVFRRVVTRSAFAIVRFVKALILFFGRFFYRLIGIPVLTFVRAVFALVRIVYVIGCRLENGVAAMVSVILKIVFFPVRNLMTPERRWRKKLQEWEQGFWVWLSNLLKKKPRSVS